MKSLRKMLVLGTLTVATMLPSLSEAGVRVYVRHRPPAPRIAVVPRTPFAGAIWVSGYWRWTGHCHAWVDGHYLKPRKGHVYVPGHWQHDRYGWYWVDGHWRRA